MKKIVKALFFLIVLSVALFRISAAADKEKEKAPDPKFKGTMGCTMCHKKLDDATTKWEASKHAKAFEVLASEEAKKISKDAQKDPKCLECHTTGFGKPDGYAVDMDAKKAVQRVGVTCESCHGAGELYIKPMMKASEFKLETAQAAGLTLPTKEVCEKCHNKTSPTFKEFDFEKSIKEVKHGEKLPPKKEEK